MSIFLVDRKPHLNERRNPSAYHRITAFNADRLLVYHYRVRDKKSKELIVMKLKELPEFVLSGCRECINLEIPDFMHEPKRI